MVLSLLETYNPLRNSNKKLSHLLDEKAYKLLKTTLVEFYNLDIPLIEIDNTDKQIKEVLQLQRNEDKTPLTSKKISLPFEFVRREIVENTNINDKNEVYFSSGNETIKYKGKMYFISNKWQGFVLRLLYDKHDKDINVLSSNDIFDAINEKSVSGDDVPTESKLSRLFRGKAAEAAFKAMIVTETKGRYRFNLP
jgi:hypothetical protein